MRFSPSAPEIGGDGFDKNDIFNRAPLAKALTRLLRQAEEPLVIALDAPWGTGKSVFLQMWAAQLRNQDFPVIYFDAFANDYVDDAFSVLASELVSFYRANKSKEELFAESFTKKAVDVGVMLSRGAAKIATHMAVKAVTAGLVDASDVSDMATEILDSTARTVISDIISDTHNKKSALVEFRELLSAFPSQFMSAGNSGQPEGLKPLIFIIDELDRCRPSFALSILERVKHFMSVPNVHFVYGLNKVQMEHAVRHQYGLGTDASTYLQKFFDYSLSLPTLVHSNSDSHYRKYVMHSIGQSEFNDNRTDELFSACETIANIAYAKKLTLRDIDKISTVLKIAFAFSFPKTLMTGFLLGGLAVLKLRAPDIYDKAKAGDLRYLEICDYFQLDLDVSRNKSFMEIWEYFISDQPSPDLLQYNSAFFMYNIRNRKDVVPHLANNVIELMSGHR